MCAKNEVLKIHRKTSGTIDCGQFGGEFLTPPIKILTQTNNIMVAIARKKRDII